MIPENKVTEIFVMADDFCKFFDQMMEKYSIPDKNKRKYHRDGTMSKAEIMVILILFHSSGYRFARKLKKIVGISIQLLTLDSRLSTINFYKFSLPFRLQFL